jgi:putative CocE/NonD family hydrolase
MSIWRKAITAAAFTGLLALAAAQPAAAAPKAKAPAVAPGDPSLLPPATGDIPTAKDEGAPAKDDYIKRVVMIPMRDGVKLYTVIVIPKGAHDAPMLLTRTPYNAAKRATRALSPNMLSTLPPGDEVFVRDGYIRVFQDTRGKYGSEGIYVMTQPVRGPLNAASTDETTDAWDTVDWLSKHMPESNGRVGMVGSSYEGFTVVMALLDPHPALKVAAPESPMVDGWMGDDWFHYGAFRQPGFDFVHSQSGQKGAGEPIPTGVYDDYTGFLRGGSAGAWATAHGLDGYPWWRRMEAHPAYDAFWQGQALDKLLAAKGLKIPVMWEQGLWDQEDMWGAIHSYEALKAAGTPDAMNHLVMGPWRHSQANYEGFNLGVLKWEGDTGLQWRRDVLKPFFDQYLKTGARKVETPTVMVYNTGENHWDRFSSWPLACEHGCASPMKPLYLQENFGLSFDKPQAAGAASDAYVSDPSKPVPYLPQPVHFGDGAAWQRWLVTDQRFVADRPDVLVYETAVLTAPVHISGQPVADIYASTSGTDSDWVVKVIDVYPDEVASNPEMGGYQLNVSLDIFRGRYRDSFEHPSPIPADKAQRYRFTLPPTNHVFLPGHRIMVQIQSTLFPLYDRNPQTYVDNIFLAKPGDYQKATQHVFRSGDTASAVWLPVAP